jgi:hypothetical protein
MFAALSDPLRSAQGLDLQMKVASVCRSRIIPALVARTHGAAGFGVCQLAPPMSAHAWLSMGG